MSLISFLLLAYPYFVVVLLIAKSDMYVREKRVRQLASDQMIFVPPELDGISDSRIGNRLGS